MRRIASLKLAMTMRSGSYLNAISNRLAGSSERARFLGMVIGEALSALSDKPDNRMKFKLEELESDESMWYKYLTQVNDSIGSLETLKLAAVSRISKTAKKTKKAPSNPNLPQPTSKIVAIEELSDNYEESDDDGLVPYSKPDSDAEDSDEDPTLIERDKPTAPVYIRDLIAYLRDTENYHRQKLGLHTAHSLIRRKANFGAEVSDHVEELATLLVGLQDKFEIENFQDMRVQGMIAVLLSQPKKMAPWFSKTFFDGDYSLSQRASILTVLSISARELAGFKEQDSSLTTLKVPSSNLFPSKKLPARLHKLYASEQQHHQAIDSLSSELANTMIQPIAASLADRATGPDVLKVRTFSSRLAVEARRKPAKVNDLSTIVASSFFFPLTGRFSAHFKAFGAGNVIFAPFLLSSFLKTLALIIHASGTNTLELQQMTSEFWQLLLNTRAQAQRERAVGQAILFGFMTILEINDDKRRFVEMHGQELTETQKWVDLYFQSLGSGSDEDDKIRSLAAGVLLKIREVVDKYQALLMGNTTSF
jgi:telomere length regulation protein